MIAITLVGLWYAAVIFSALCYFENHVWIKHIPTEYYYDVGKAAAFNGQNTNMTDLVLERG